MLYVGLDVHKEKVYGAVLDEKGNVIKEEKFGNTQEGFEEFFLEIPEATVALEAMGFSYPAYDLLEERGYTAHLAHPLKTRIIGEARIKTDKIDATTLAQLVRTDFLPTSYVPDKHVREIREMVRQRAYLVRMRTKLKNKIHGELAKTWTKPEMNLFTEKGKQWLQELHNERITTYLGIIGHLDIEIRTLSTKISAYAEANRDAHLLMTIPGIHHYAAMMILSEIGDIHRFSNSHKLCSYAGLVPATHQTGNTTYHGHIIKQGSKWLRWILVQCVHTHVRYDTALTRFYHKIERKHGTTIAVVATASKLLRVIYQMLRTAQRFHPFPVVNTTVPRTLNSRETTSARMRTTHCESHSEG